MISYADHELLKCTMYLYRMCCICLACANNCAVGVISDMYSTSENYNVKLLNLNSFHVFNILVYLTWSTMYYYHQFHEKKI